MLRYFHNCLLEQVRGQQSSKGHVSVGCLMLYLTKPKTASYYSYKCKCKSCVYFDITSIIIIIWCRHVTGVQQLCTIKWFSFFSLQTNLIVQIQFHTVHTVIENCRFRNLVNNNNNNNNNNKFVIYCAFLQHLISIN